MNDGRPDGWALPPQPKTNIVKKLFVVAGFSFAGLLALGAVGAVLGLGDKPASHKAVKVPSSSHRTTSTPARAPVRTTTSAARTTTVPVTTTTEKRKPKPKQYSASQRSEALTLGVGVLQDVQSHNQTISRDNDLGLQSQVMADCRDGYQALPGWRSTIAGIDMPANIKTPFSRGLDETEAAYKSCVEGNFTATSTHFSAAYDLFQQATNAVDRWGK
jgi:hypothetical protein